MKIACQSCQAKYTIADEKVLGKVVKIRCKKCSATIVINGNESQGADAGGGDGGAGVFDYTGPSSNEQWTVNVADGDQRTLAVAEIMREYRGGVITDETYCWKDGMADWLPLREIESLYSACSMAPRPSLEDVPQSVRPPAGMGGGMGGGMGAGLGGGAALFGGGAEAPTEERHVNGNGNGASLFGGGDASPSPAPAAARRVGGRGGGGADLFGSVAQAGGEADVVARGAGGGGGGGGDVSAEEPKLTGQRNENSVLFSLSALTNDQKGAPPPAPKDRTTAQADGSGLIDIRALSANMSKDDKSGKNHVDDIMNLSGGGAFGAALAAPILAPPPVQDFPAGGEAQSKSNKTMLFGLLGAGAFIAIAIIVAVVVLKSGSSTTTAGNGPNGNTSSNGPVPSVSVAMNDPGTGATPAGGATGVTSGTTSPTPPPADSTPTATVPGANTKVATAAGGNTGAWKPPSGGGNPTPKNTADPSPPSNPTPPAAPAGGGSFDDALRKAAGAPPPTAPPAAQASDQPVDRGALTAAMGGVNINSCKKPDGPTGSGHVTVTFSNSGSVQSAVVDQPPFAGTPVGGCIAGKYRSAHIPAFGGSPVKVGKSFSLN